ncbi:MAG: UDP-N-acetylmuramoyl-L-alanine--D-glutamate ligase [Janthinobacterium lividum]
MHTEFENKTIAVVGLARSGLACCQVLTRLGAHVIPYDGKPAEALTDALAEVTALGLTPIISGAALDYSRLDYVVTSPGVRKDAAVLQDAVAAGVPVLGEIEAAYRIARAPILAITGTNGKTTTTLLLGEMLRAAGIETYIAGNIAAGDIAMPLIQAAFDAPPEAAIVAEISSFQLEWISTFRPKVAALLNISPDHGDRQTWEEYVAAKLSIFENQTEEDAGIWNSGSFNTSEADTIFQSFDAVVMASRVTLWLVDPEPQEWDCNRSVWRGEEAIYVSPSQVDASSQGAVVLSPPTVELCKVADVKLPGAHNLENIMAAAAMATAFGVGIEPIRKVATTFTGVVHRLETVETIDGVKYVNNSMCTNADAFAKSLEALPEPKVVIAGGVFKGGDVATLAEAVVQNNVRALVLIGRSAPEIEAAARTAGYQNVHRAGTLIEAVTQAAGLAQAGDTVLLAPACASFDMFADFEDRGDQFKAAVRGMAGATGKSPRVETRG